MSVLRSKSFNKNLHVSVSTLTIIRGLIVVPDTVTPFPLAYFLFIPACGSIYLFVCVCLVPADAMSG